MKQHRNSDLLIVQHLPDAEHCPSMSKLYCLFWRVLNHHTPGGKDDGNQPCLVKQSDAFHGSHPLPKLFLSTTSWNQKSQFPPKRCDCNRQRLYVFYILLLWAIFLRVSPSFFFVLGQAELKLPEEGFVSRIHFSRWWFPLILYVHP